jgi:hypothetical protein
MVRGGSGGSGGCGGHGGRRISESRPFAARAEWALAAAVARK